MYKQDCRPNKIDGLPGDHPDKLEELYHDQELTQREIADWFDCGRSTVHRAMVDHSIERRDWYKDHATLTNTQKGHLRWNGPVGDDGKRKWVGVHQLLAIADGGDPHKVFEDWVDVHHKNGIPWDNRPSNLEVLSRSEHKARHGGEKSPDKPWRDRGILKQMYAEEGLTPTQMSDRLGCDGTTVIRWLRKYDLYQDRKSVEESPWRDRQTLVDLYWGEMMGVVEIGEELGCSITTVSTWLNRHGIETRNGGENE